MTQTAQLLVLKKALSTNLPLATDVTLGTQVNVMASTQAWGVYRAQHAGRALKRGEQLAPARV